MGYNDLISISMKPDRFIFTVESTGAMRPEEIVMRALEILKEKLTNLHSHLNHEPDPSNFE